MNSNYIKKVYFYNERTKRILDEKNDKNLLQ